MPQHHSSSLIELCNQFFIFIKVQGIEVIHAHVNHLIENYGYLGIFLAMFFQGIVMLFPAYLIMPLAGYYASEGKLSILGGIVSGFLGAYLATTLLYELGRRMSEFTFGDQLSNKNFILKHSFSVYRKSKVWFDRFGGIAVFWCRFFPLARTMISLVAGVENMSRKKFHILTSTGTFLYTSFLVFSGYILKEHWSRVGNYTTPIAKLFMPIFIILTSWFVVIMVFKLFAGMKRRIESGL